MLLAGVVGGASAISNVQLGSLGLLRSVTDRIDVIKRGAGTQTAVEQAKSYSPCRADSPTFILGFADLKQAVGDAMREAAGCEHPDGRTGNSMQATNKGTAFYDSQTNTTTFTDGWAHWRLGPAGLVYWEGKNAEPDWVSMSSAVR